MTTASLDDAVRELLEEWGIQARPVYALVELLATSQPLTIERLIEESGLSHRTVTDVLRRLEPWLKTTRTGHRLTESGESESPSPRWGRAGEGAVAPPPDLLQRLTDLKASGPGRRRELDHVAATPATCVRRAAFLASRYELDGAHVLFLGDHDLTSLALALVVPSVRIAVVDMDDDLLEHVDRSARELGVTVTCRFADLRIGLPPALREWADLVFTDPPYTPEGVRLFSIRGCQALRRDDRSRLLVCYGYGERQPALGLKVQAALHGLKLLVEEVRPGFNRYDGAQAIGGASALYVTRPLAATWKAIEQEARPDERIYSHGPRSVEAPARALPGALAAELPDPLPAGELWRLAERHATARPERRPRMPQLAAADLSRDQELAPRLLLLHRGPRLRLALPAAAATALLTGWQAGLLGAAYHLREVARAGSLAVVEAERREDPVEGPELLARHVVSHPAASLASSLREGLIAAGAATTQNEARALLARFPVAVEGRPADLPLHALRALSEALPLLTGEGAAHSV